MKTHKSDPYIACHVSNKYFMWHKMLTTEVLWPRPQCPLDGLFLTKANCGKKLPRRRAVWMRVVEWVLAASSAGPTPDSDYAPPAYSSLGINSPSSFSNSNMGCWFTTSIQWWIQFVKSRRFFQLLCDWCFSILRTKRPAPSKFILMIAKWHSIK